MSTAPKQHLHINPDHCTQFNPSVNHVNHEALNDVTGVSLGVIFILMESIFGVGKCEAHLSEFCLM